MTMSVMPTSSITTVESASDWWKTSDLGECPITLESLNTLPYAPFMLHRNYFDGFALASFIVSRGVFQNPLTREELTHADCRRLDEYLEDFCYNHDATEDFIVGMTRRKVSVTEAFALRNSVHVGNNSSGVSAEALRNAATSALVGLFVYGNDRRRRLYEQQPELTQQPTMDPLLSEWGFDLSRTVENTAQVGEHGYMVIDDDEANVVASQQTAYEAVQEAFPPLYENANGEYSGNSIPGAHIDERLLEQMRRVSLQEQRSQEQRARALQRAREQLLREALARREERRKQRNLERIQNAQKHQQQKEEQAEIQQARSEIDAWRDEQWEKLRILSDQHQQRERQKIMISKTLDTPTVGGSMETKNERDNKPLNNNSDAVLEEELAAHRKKEKASAKRKRARERQKLKKAVQQQEREREEQKRALEDQKAASKVKCDPCGGGILGCGFEKFGKVFCSTKCARSAAKQK